MRAEAHVKITLTVTLTLTLKFQQYEYQHVGLVEFYPVICSSWRSDTAVKTYIAVPCFPSVPVWWNYLQLVRIHSISISGT